MDKAIIVVHPFTSDKYLYTQIKRRDWKVVTLITPFDKEWIKHCQKNIYQHSDHVLVVTGEKETDIHRLEKLCQEYYLKIGGVINCFDSSVEYADILANHFLHLDLNILYSRIRCNKFRVNEVLSQSNMSYIRTFLFNLGDSIEGTLNKIREVRFPVIVKPTTNSAARNHVMFASDDNSLRAILQNITEIKNIFTHQPIHSFVIQEYIEGVEYFVNASSYCGQHYTSGVFKYKKEKGRLLGAWSISSAEQTIVQQLIDYNHQCLDALKVQYGITHNEFILDKNGVPYLIEMNNRMAGGETPKYSHYCYHSDEISFFLDLIEHQEVRKFDIHHIYSYAALPMFVNFHNPEATQLNMESITSSYDDVIFRPGIVESEEKNLYRKVSAALWLKNDDSFLLEQDSNLLFSREGNGTLFI